MGKIKDPSTFASQYDVDPSEMTKLGVLNPTLGVDTNLFIDPLLLAKSHHEEISVQGVAEYVAHFEMIVKLLAASSQDNDVAWRAARRFFQFHEIPATCLGYGASSTKGSAFGKKLIENVMHTGKEIVDLGITDPDLFVALAIFEEGIGPDRISDMATNVILDALVSFNERILDTLNVPAEPFEVAGKQVELARNPVSGPTEPVLLVPTDVLKRLPIATDWDGVESAAAHNSSMRLRVNQHIGHLWSAKTKRDKRTLRDEALASAEAFKTLLDLLHEAKNTPYDAEADPLGLRRWAETAQEVTKAHPLNLVVPEDLDLDGVHKVVLQIVEQFKQLVEHNGLAKSLWNGDKHLPESYAQRLFFAVAYSYCRANDLDISPEADSGRGPVDFKVSIGFNRRVLVEIKLSSNPKVVAGYTKQLEAYKAAEESIRAIFLVLDVGKMGRKDQALYQARNDASGAGNPVSDIEIVDAIPKPSASKL